MSGPDRDDRRDTWPRDRRGWALVGCHAAAAMLLLAALGGMAFLEDASLGVLLAVLAVATVRFLVVDAAGQLDRPAGGPGAGPSEPPDRGA